jgi:probable F420-dependent oxidoreductase
MKFASGVPGTYRFPLHTDAWMTKITAPDFQRVCRRLEAIGFDSIDSPEHVAVDRGLLSVMGAHWPHAMTAMAFFAGATERIRVNSSILVLPAYHPVNLAKAIATLDQLSGGRVMLTIGIGVGEAEFRAVGVPYKERGRRADEYLEAMNILWRESNPVFHGKYVQFDNIAFEPKPLQRPVPVWVGGNSDAAIRRALRFAAGWRPSTVVLETLAPYREKIARFADSLGRATPLEIHLQAGPASMGEDHKLPAGGAPPPMSAGELSDRIGKLAEAGVTWTSLPRIAARSLDEYLDRLEAEHGPIIAQWR